MTFRGGSIVAVATTIMIEVTSNYQVEYGEYRGVFLQRQKRIVNYYIKKFIKESQ